MEKLLVDTIEENFKRINENICNAALKAGKNSKEITLLAATKTVPPDIINYAISLGITDIGENRVQELNSKYDSLKLENCNLHMIGHLQTVYHCLFANGLDIRCTEKFAFYRRSLFDPELSILWNPVFPWQSLHVFI